MEGIELLGFAGLVLCLVLLPTAAVSAVKDIRRGSAQRAADADPIAWPASWEDMVQANMGVPPARRNWAAERRAALNYRHNVHCPSCGRFSKMNGGIILCRVHGLAVRVATGPIGVIANANDILDLPSFTKGREGDLAISGKDGIDNSDSHRREVGRISILLAPGEDSNPDTNGQW